MQNALFGQIFVLHRTVDLTTLHIRPLGSASYQPHPAAFQGCIYRNAERLDAEEVPQATQMVCDETSCVIIPVAPSAGKMHGPSGETDPPPPSTLAFITPHQFTAIAQVSCKT